MNALLTISDLQVVRQGRTVLDIPALEIERGRVTALVGPNGAGKTTLLQLLTGLIRPQQGRIVYAGRPVEGLPDLSYRRRLALVMQDSLLLDRSVFDNVALGLRFRRLPKTEVLGRVELWLERLGIASLRKRRAVRLSGGEAQRVALARALVLEPELLLLDEPFRSLDRSAHNSLLADLKGLLPVTGTTTVFSSHSESEVRKLADRQVELEGGRIRPSPA